MVALLAPTHGHQRAGESAENRTTRDEQRENYRFQARPHRLNRSTRPIILAYRASVALHPLGSRANASAVQRRTVFGVAEK